MTPPSFLRRAPLHSFVVLCAALALFGGVANSSAQQTYYWRSEASNGNWNYGGNWYHSDNSSSSDIPGGNENINFDNGNQLTMTNDLPNTSRYRINFLNGSGARTINGTAANTFFDYNTNVPAIYNASGNTQTINFDVIDGNSNGANRLEFNANSGGLVFGGAVSASGGNRTIAFLGSGGTSISGQVTQASAATLSLSVEGAGTVTLSNTNNNFTGTTSISGGTLTPTANGSLGGGLTNHTSGITVSGGALLLGGTSTVTDRISDATPVSLSGGAFNTAGFSERVGALTLTANSTSDLGAGTSTLIFGGASTRTGGTLAFSNWTSGSDHVFFYADSTSTTAYTVPDGLLSNITINGLGVTELSTGEIVPVPEPATWLAGFLTFGLGAYGLRRRQRPAA